MKKQAHIYYQRLVEDPRWVDTMKGAWKIKTLEYANQVKEKEAFFIQRLIEVNPDYKYPDPSKKFEYWDNAKQMAYTKACKVISDLERSLAPPAETSTPAGSIVEPYLLKLIFKEYGHNFEGETLDQWKQRFSTSDINVPPIKVRADAREGSDRLILLAILASVHKTTGNGYPFAKYVESHFGISAFDSAKSRNKEKVTFRNVMKDCDRILRRTTM